MPTYTPENSVFDGPTTNLPSAIRIVTEIVSRADTKGGKSLSGFKFGTFVDRFLSDRETSMAVKGLNLES